MDLAVGAKKDDDGGINTGAAYILFMNTNGSIKSYSKINYTDLGGELVDYSYLGTSLANIGDLDNDGIIDLAAGEAKIRTMFTLFMNSNGSVKLSVPINLTYNNERFTANAITKIGDFDNDGDRKSTRLNSSHIPLSRMPSSA